MAVIELAKKGQEAITYELIISIHNAAASLSVAVATQLLTPFDSVVCKTGCTVNEVNVTSVASYIASNGPTRFTDYSLFILGINLVSLVMFTSFLPRQKAECHEWRKKGESGQFFLSATKTGIVSTVVSTLVIGYYLVASIAFLVPSLSCLPLFGGGGCPPK